MADFLITSLRGGLNEDAPISIADDQATVALNVEWVKSRLGERRKGAIEIDLTGSDIATYSRVTWAHMHYPSSDPAEAQLWLLGVKDSPLTATFVYKDSNGWTTVAPDDAINTSYVYQVTSQSLHGDLFIAYKSSVDRLHKWDGTSLRRCGIAEPSAAPTGANSGSGTFSGTRYYRVRFTMQSAGTTLVRSEPSDVLTHAPNGSGTGVTVTRPTTTGADADVTHWELEASLNDSDFYRIATTAIATTTATDTQAFSSGYANDFTVSEDIGDYDLIPSVRYLSADEDRLVCGGSFEDEALASRVMWTPVFNEPGVGNDERLQRDTDPSKDLDNQDGGGLTALSATVNGYIFAAKQSHLYQMSRSGVRTKAYEVHCLTKYRGAIEGSMVAALDNTGNPTLFALDPDVGPVRFGPRGVEPCGLDLPVTWDSVNLDATTKVCCSCYFPEKKQVHWWIATGSSNVPDTRIVLHTQEMRETLDGMRGGWAKWSGPSAAALTACLFSTNVNDMGSGASNVLAPVIGVVGDGIVWLTDEEDDDNGTAYSARIVTKPYVHGNLLHQFECKAGAVMARAAASTSLDITIIGTVIKSDGTSEQIEQEVEAVSFAPSGSESFVTRAFDDLELSELRTVQVEFEDPATPGAQWFLDQFVLLESGGQRA